MCGRKVPNREVFQAVVDAEVVRRLKALSAREPKTSGWSNFTQAHNVLLLIVLPMLAAFILQDLPLFISWGLMVFPVIAACHLAYKVSSKTLYKIMWIAGIVAVFVTGCIFHINFHKRQENEDLRKEAVRHLEFSTIQPDDPKDPFSAGFSFTNNSDYEFSNKHFSCFLVFGVRENGNVEHNGVIGSGLADTLSAHGDAETFKCSDPFGGMPNPIVCADMILDLSFSVKGLPKEILEKKLRVVTTNRNNSYLWVPDALNRKESLCMKAAN